MHEPERWEALRDRGRTIVLGPTVHAVGCGCVGKNGHPNLKIVGAAGVPAAPTGPQAQAVAQLTHARTARMSWPLRRTSKERTVPVRAGKS